MNECIKKMYNNFYDNLYLGDEDLMISTVLQWWEDGGGETHPKQTFHPL